MEETPMSSQLGWVKNFLEILKSFLLLVGLCVMILVWCVVIFFLWIYDAIFGGWK
tara:strand:+ start:381 stop:545 length:165 start_codon:yes stop_codon:yes gene_type:complete